MWPFCKSYFNNILFVDICQLRLDFDNFVTRAVSTTGACTDTFTVTSPSGKSPAGLCGTLTGMHCKLSQGFMNIQLSTPCPESSLV